MYLNVNIIKKEAVMNMNYLAGPIMMWEIFIQQYSNTRELARVFLQLQQQTIIRNGIGYKLIRLQGSLASTKNRRTC